MTTAFGTVTGVTPGGTRPDVANVDTGGPDGIDALWCRPGSLQVGDTVVIRQVGAVWLVDDCTSRKVFTPDVVPLIDFATAAPTGSQISSWYRRPDSTDAKPHLTAVYSSGAPPVVPAGTNTRTFVASAGGTWDDSNQWRDGTVRQGIYPGFPHQAYGVWLFDTATMVAAMAGATVTRCDVTTTRTTGQGAGGKIDLQLYTHTLTGPANGQPAFQSVGTVSGAPQGAPASFTVPQTVAQALAAGTVTGLGITATSVAAYCGYLPDMTLTFTY